MADGTPAAEIDVDERLVRTLLAEQAPQYAALAVAPFASGWDNFMFRLGEDLLVRLPRRSAGQMLIENELRWLPQLPDLPFPTPRLQHHGRPSADYPWNWSVLTYIEGEPADIAWPDASEAVALATFLKMLHQPAHPDAWVNTYRGCPLANREADTEERLRHLRANTDSITPAVSAAWAAGLAAPVGTRRLRLHGDMHAQNILVRGGKLAGVIDWGDTCCGDPASDLLSIWALFESAKARRAALDAYGATLALEARARGWAVSIAAVLLLTGLANNPRHAKMGRDMLRRVEEDAAKT